MWNWTGESSECGTGLVDRVHECGTGLVDRVSLELDWWIK